jgi:hypothetical protein
MPWKSQIGVPPKSHETTVALIPSSTPQVIPAQNMAGYALYSLIGLIPFRTLEHRTGEGDLVGESCRFEVIIAWRILRYSPRSPLQPKDPPGRLLLPGGLDILFS